LASASGIAPEDQQRIFDEFVRLDGRAGAEGLGLGLAIVKRIADLIGGEIALDSKLGEGARFMLRIPIARSTHAPAPTPAVASRGVAGMPILVMDDDPLALEAAAGVLRDLGAEVRACRNEGDVDSALRDGFAPKLLVMDLRVDGMLQGVDIAERARAKLSPPPPVIMVTGDTAPDTLGTLRQSGHTWLIKPVSRDDLAAAVAEAHADAT
jgi:CheY-like chemotaxis protein